MADDPREHQDGEHGDDDARRGTSPAEWAVAALGFALVVAVIAALLRDAFGGPQRPPDVTVAVDTVARGRGGWLVAFEARNAGDESVADLAVRATLVGPRGDTLVREARVDYLPARSKRGGAFVFPADPRAGALRLEALGFQEP